MLGYLSDRFGIINLTNLKRQGNENTISTASDSIYTLLMTFETKLTNIKILKFSSYPFQTKAIIEFFKRILITIIHVILNL